MSDKKKTFSILDWKKFWLIYWVLFGSLHELMSTKTVSFNSNFIIIQCQIVLHVSALHFHHQVLVQGGSNMTGTDCGLIIHK